MAKFDAGTAVDPMEYDFTKYGGSAGEIPEPSEKMITAFMRVIRDEADKAGLDVSDPDNAKIGAALSEVTSEEDDRIMSAIVDAMAVACSHKPSADEINALPFRVKQAFYGWFMGEMSAGKDLTGSKD